MTTLQVNIPESSMRLDRYLSQNFPDYTRSFLKKLIIAGKISHNGTVTTKASTIIASGDTITIESFEQPPREISVKGYENFFKKRLIHSDEHFLVLNKPAGLIVHPSSETSPVVTLSDILVAHYPEVATVGEAGRPGIVHRLDGDTSGIILVARTQHGYDELTKLFRSRTIKKTYSAVVKGHPEQSGRVDEPVERHPLDPRKMTCVGPKLRKKGLYPDKVTELTGELQKSKEALTDYTVTEYFEGLALLEILLHTGRTHQIRVHMSRIGHPVLGDSMYGVRDQRIKRQALHAHKLEFEFDGKKYEFTAPLAGDMKQLIIKAKEA